MIIVSVRMKLSLVSSSSLPKRMILIRRCSRRTWFAFAGTRVPDSHFPSAGSGGTNNLGKLKSSGSGVSVGLGGGAVAGGLASGFSSPAFCCRNITLAWPRKLVTSPADAKAVAVAMYAPRRAALVALDVPMSPRAAICSRLQANAISSKTSAIAKSSLMRRTVH